VLDGDTCSARCIGGRSLMRMPDLSVRTQAASLNIGDTLTIVGIVIALIAIAVGIWAARKYGTRRGVVLFTCNSTQLIPDLPSSAKDLLKVEYRDFPVPDPHLVNLRLQNVGPRDIASSNFDAGRPITIKTNCKFYGFVSISHPKRTVGRAIGSDGVIDIEPMLLKTAETWEISAIISGRPTIEIDAPLVDVNILDRKALDAKVARSFLANVFRSALAGAGGGLALATVDALIAHNHPGDS
jgi:hypothetical protein